MESPTTTRKLCQHCKSKFANRPRQTCWTCYYTPGVRDLFTPSKYAHRGVGGHLDGSEDKQPDRPTPALQGTTPDKLDAMAERAERGVSLFHPADGRV